MEENYKSEKKIAVSSIILVLLIIVGAIGATVAFFNVTASKGGITASANCYTVNYTKGQDIAGELVVGTDYTSGHSTDVVMYSNPNCNLLAGTLYITTNPESTMDLSDQALRYTVVANNQVLSEGYVNGQTNQPIYSDFILNTTATTYKVYIWLDATKENMQSGPESYSGFIHSDVVVTADFPAHETLVQLGLTSSSVTPDFSKTSCSSGCDEATVGIYEAEDDLGTSYYFRGDVTNNYVKFGKNESGQDMYWRIIRINGDGTVRMIYDGTQVHDNGTSSTNRRVGTSAFNTTATDNTYLGYMYGDTGQSTYELTHSNKYNSTIKTYLEGTSANNYTDGWYYKNIVATGYNDYVADAIYCNDRTLQTGTGIGSTNTDYGSRKRVVSNKQPTLKCDLDNNTTKRDSFTVGTNLGNGLLKYPVGLITADEISYAGSVYDTNNESYYLYSGNIFWTMSPYRLNSGTSRMFRVVAAGALGLQGVTSAYGVRPVISLKADAIKSGDGTKSSPFSVEEVTSDQVLANLGLSVTSGTPNFANTSCSSGCGETTVGIYAAEDDLGTSYYFRGDVTNNYVKFGKNESNNDMYWRIVRINGDGTVRMIYDGTQAHDNGDGSSDKAVGVSYFSSGENDNTYVGYMYGDTGQSTFASTHSNKYDSPIKTYLEGTSANNYTDGWYYKNIVATGYSGYVADAIYCNDRSLYSGTGIGTAETYYGAYGRLYTNKQPTLKCDLDNNTTKRDSFTANTRLGNGLLNYPVGLITADEVSYAGGVYYTDNESFYLYLVDFFWFASPGGFESPGYLSVFAFDIGGSNGGLLDMANNNYKVRPVISLKSTAIKYGTGTKGDPFRVE